MKLFTKIFFSISLILLLIGCRKEFNDIGLNLRDDYLSPDCDTTAIVAYSIPEDSVNTTNLTGFVGKLTDPVFGNIEAGVYAKYLLSETGVSFGINPVFDSIVLTIQYSGYYGDTMSNMQLQVYEMEDLLDNKTSYYHTQTQNYNPVNLLYNSAFTFQPKPTTIISSASDSIRYPAHLRVRLSDELGQRFINNPNNLKDNTSLHDIFKGLYITASTTSLPGCMIYFNLRGSISAINLYYHNDSGNRRYIFNTPSTSVHYSAVTFDRSSSSCDFKRQVLDGETELGKKKLYIQPMGVKTLISFPYIETYREKDQIINKAELVIPAIYDAATDGCLLPPSALTLRLVSENGDVGTIDDYWIGSAYFGGTYDKNEECYRFRITKYVQQLIQGKFAKSKLYLIASGTNRLVISGTDQTMNKHIRLELYYTNY